MYNESSSNSIKHNNVYENTNGIYIDSNSKYDIINANTFTSNRRDPNCELGGYESGNGLLFGADFKTAKEGSAARLQVKYNVLGLQGDPDDRGAGGLVALELEGLQGLAGLEQGHDIIEYLLQS